VELNVVEKTLQIDLLSNPQAQAFPFGGIARSTRKTEPYTVVTH